MGEQESIKKFFITNLGEDWAILGYPWIEHFDPPFDWKEKKLKGDTKVKFKVKYYKYAHTQVIKSFICTIGREIGLEPGDKILKVNMAQQWAEVTQKGKKEVQGSFLRGSSKMLPPFKTWEPCH
jgi:hypothetical protein